jgi:hypothetical protein
MLAEFLHKQETDIILLQEVTHNDFDITRRYNAYTNVGINKRGAAMLTRETIHLNKITRLPSGWGMAAVYRGVRVLNIYIYIYIYARRLAHPIYRRENSFTMWNSIVVVPAPTMIIGWILTAS